MSIRDPSQMGATDWAARGPLMPRNLKQTIKKDTTQNPKDQTTKDLSPTNRFVKVEGTEAPKEYKKSFEARAEEAEKQKLEMAKKEAYLKPENRDWKPLGAVDFSRHDLTSFANTRNNRYQLDKQIKSISTSTAFRSNVIKALADKTTSAGKLSKYDAKHAIWKLNLPKTQQQKLFKKLGI